MDRIIATYAGIEKEGLVICPDYGVAYQKNMRDQITYGKSYFQHYDKKRDSEISKKINSSRISMVISNAGKADLLDTGIGSGEFIENYPYKALGFDINPIGVEWLQKHGLFFDTDRKAEWDGFQAFTFWDVLEHVDFPERIFRKIPKDAWLFTSIPIFKDIEKVKKSKHFKPKEHLYYFELGAFIEWMGDWGFSLKELRNDEMLCGRDMVYSFAFKNDLPRFDDLVLMYKEIHTSKHYGSSSDMFRDQIERIIFKRKFKKILDYGCGRSDLAAYLWAGGARKVERYDPAIPKYKEMPSGFFDLVICNDTLEHILKRDVHRILKEIRDKGQNTLFSIATKPSRQKLPNGMNSHVCLMPETWWRDQILSHYDKCEKMGDYEIGFICKTF